MSSYQANREKRLKRLRQLHPLCLECDGEVLAYNSKHPIGTKYEGKELRPRRDNWYKEVKNGSPTRFRTSYTKIDRRLVERLSVMQQRIAVPSVPSW